MMSNRLSGESTVFSKYQKLGLSSIALCAIILLLATISSQSTPATDITLHAWKQKSHPETNRPSDPFPNDANDEETSEDVDLVDESEIISVNPNEIVPFYVYDPYLFSGFTECIKSLDKITNEKFDTDLQLIMAMTRHPWRVYDLEKAKIAVVPILWNRIGRGGCSGSNSKHITNMKKVLGSNLYRTDVKHMVIANDFKTKYIVRSLHKFKSLLIAVKLHRRRERCRFGIGFSTVYGAWKMWEHDEFVYKMPKPLGERKYFVSFLGQTDKGEVS